MKKYQHQMFVCKVINIISDILIWPGIITLLIGVFNSSSPAMITGVTAGIIGFILLIIAEVREPEEICYLNKLNDSIGHALKINVKKNVEDGIILDCDEVNIFLKKDFSSQTVTHIIPVREGGLVKLKLYHLVEESEVVTE